MLIIALCIGLGAICSLLVTAAASQLRHRNVAPLEVEVRPRQAMHDTRRDELAHIRS